MTVAVMFAALALVRPAEYPRRPEEPPVCPARYFEFRPQSEPTLTSNPYERRNRYEPKFEHVIEGLELIEFRRKPDPEPYPLPEQPKDYATWLKQCDSMPSIDAKKNILAFVSEFVKNRNGDIAFEIFIRLTAGKSRSFYRKCTQEEVDYFLRFAANHGSARARQFFDEKGELKTGLAYEYVFAEYVDNYLVRRPYPSDLAGAPGNGMPGTFRAYDAGDELKKLLAQYSLDATWFDYSIPQPPDPNAEGYARAVECHQKELRSRATCYNALPPSLPFLAYRPKAAKDTAVPLVVYIPGNGEQGEDLTLQFRQTACLRKVTSADFQAKHAAYMLIIAPPIYGNVNIGHGYPVGTANRLNEEYNDLILAYVRAASEPRIDPARIYLTGLGSGAATAIAMALDHPGRYAAVAPVWGGPYTSVVHPDRPGNWRFFNRQRPPWNSSKSEAFKAIEKLNADFKANVRAGGGDCKFVWLPYDLETNETWWNGVWSSDELWDWMFSKRAD